MRGCAIIWILNELLNEAWGMRGPAPFTPLTLRVLPYLLKFPSPQQGPSATPRVRFMETGVPLFSLSKSYSGENVRIFMDQYKILSCIRFQDWSQAPKCERKTQSILFNGISSENQSNKTGARTQKARTGKNWLNRWKTAIVNLDCKIRMSEWHILSENFSIPSSTIPCKNQVLNTKRRNERMWEPWTDGKKGKRFDCILLTLPFFERFMALDSPKEWHSPSRTNLLSE